MRYLALAAVVLLSLSGPAHGAVTTINNGDGTTTLRAQYLVPTAKLVDVRDDVCRGAGWTALVACTPAMVAAGQCAAGQLGAQVTNPETCIQAIDRKVRAYLWDLRKAGEIKEVEDAAVKPVREADSTPDIQ